MSGTPYDSTTPTYTYPYDPNAPQQQYDYSQYYDQSGQTGQSAEYDAATQAAWYQYYQQYGYDYSAYQADTSTSTSSSSTKQTKTTQQAKKSKQNVATSSLLAAPAAAPSQSALSAMAAVTGEIDSTKKKKDKGKEKDKQAKDQKPKVKKIVRVAGGEMWEDPTLKEWDPDDYRIFVGNLGAEVDDNMLTSAFKQYPSFQKARVVRDKKSNKSRGYGFVSFKDPACFTKAMREMNDKYIGYRPVKLRKSNWQERNVDVRQLKRLQGTRAVIKG